MKVSNFYTLTVLIVVTSFLFYKVGFSGNLNKNNDSVTLNWENNLEVAKKKALELDKPILMYFTGSNWCGWCIKLDKEVFNYKEFKKFAEENFILLYLDFPRGIEQEELLEKQNLMLAEKYNIKGFPTIVLTDQNLKEIVRTGYRKGGPSNYIIHLKDILKI